MLDAVDKGTSGRIDSDEILYPTGWMLLSHLLDHRTGLERFQQLSRSTPELILTLLDYCRDHTIWEVLSLPDVEERLNLYFLCVERYKTQILRCASVHYNLVVTDMRKERVIYPGNRFMIYALFPECNVSLQVMADSGGDRTVFVAGKSVLDRSYSKGLGKILKQYGGGGHANAGTCQARGDQADEVLAKLIDELKYSELQNLLLGYFNYYQYR
jgi:nanoRNase/pAp phosphatase (c-di-AMP/oligoRNAs hydrolase)